MADNSDCSHSQNAFLEKESRVVSTYSMHVYANITLNNHLGSK